jgi:hypothetical protein
MPPPPAGLHPAALALEALARDCRVSTTRRSGPGGQHRNKVETAVVIEHLPTGICGEASERRSQDLNKQLAWFRLRLKLALAVRSEAMLAQPSELWRSRAKGGKLSVSCEHPDFPSLVAEALDQAAADQFDLPKSAERLGVSTTQLVRLLAQEPAALLLVNNERKQRNLRPLRGG